MSDPIKYEVAVRLVRVLEREGFVESAMTMCALLVERDAARDFADLQMEMAGEFKAERDAALAEVARLREALEGCVMAHQTGSYDAACAAYEDAKVALGMVPDPGCDLAPEAPHE